MHIAQQTVPAFPLRVRSSLAVFSSYSEIGTEKTMNFSHCTEMSSAPRQILEALNTHTRSYFRPDKAYLFIILSIGSNGRSQHICMF